MGTVSLVEVVFTLSGLVAIAFLTWAIHFLHARRRDVQIYLPHRVDLADWIQSRANGLLILRTGQIIGTTVGVWNFFLPSSGAVTHIMLSSVISALAVIAIEASVAAFSVNSVWMIQRALKRVSEKDADAMWKKLNDQGQ